MVHCVFPHSAFRISSSRRSFRWKERSIKRTNAMCLRSRSKKEKEALYPQLNAKKIMLKDFETGPNSPERIDQRYTTYRDLTLQLLLQGILEGEEMSKKSVYSFVSLWFENLEDEYFYLSSENHIQAIGGNDRAIYFAEMSSASVRSIGSPSKL